MKKINITGKKNIDSLNYKNTNKKSKRTNTENWKSIFKKFDNFKQTEYLNKLFLNHTYEGDNIVKKEIKNKILNYKNQDKNKNMDTSKVITYEDCLEKLVISRLVCSYCRKYCMLLYEEVRNPLQWTLDRIDNNIGHTKENVVISCLSCNIKRGVMDDAKFKFTKQLKIIKKYD